MSADTFRPKPKTCECPGCGKRVRVTFDGLLFSHTRPTHAPRRTDIPMEPPEGLTRCGWSYKPAPTESKP